MQQLEQPSSNVPCNCVQFWAAYAIRGAGFGNCVKTRLYCCSPRLICMHWVQIKQNCRTAYCQKPPFLALARIYCRILPYIAVYCHILPYIVLYCHILPYIATSGRLKTAPSPARIDCHSPARIFSQTAKSTCAIIPFCARAANPCFATFALYLTPLLFQIFFISFSLVPSMCPSILFLQWKNKASILIHQSSVVCMTFINICFSL